MTTMKSAAPVTIIFVLLREKTLLNEYMSSDSEPI